MLLAGLIAACGLLFLLLKFNLRRVLHFDIAVDVVLTFFLIWAFAGTFAGMMAGLTAGALISAFLFFAKRFVPREKLVWVKTTEFPYRKAVWVPVR